MPETTRRSSNGREDIVVARVSIDPELCIGSGECVRLMPEAFTLDDELGVSRPLPGAELADPDRLLEARGGCPTGAIAVVIEETNA